MSFKIPRSSELESLAFIMTLAMSCKILFGAKAKNLPLILLAAVLVMPQAGVCHSCHRAVVSERVCVVGRRALGGDAVDEMRW